MTRRRLVLQGGVATATMGLAWWLGERSGRTFVQGDAIVLEAARGDIERIRWEDGAIWSEVTPGRDAFGFAPWVRTSARPRPVLSGAGAGLLPPGTQPERLVRGGRIASDLFDTLAPFKALRDLGSLDAAMIKQLGLEATPKRLRITVRGIEHAFRIAAPPRGATDPYVQPEHGGSVYLVGRVIYNSFAANGLPGTELHSFSAREYDEVVFSASDRRRRYAASPAPDAQDEAALIAEGSDRRDDEAENWLRSVHRQEPIDVLGKGEVPPEGEPAIEVKVEYRVRGKGVGFVELGLAGRRAYVRTERSAGWMLLSPVGERLGSEGARLLAR